MSILDLFRLDGRVAVVTGSGRGIGRAIALALADAGADVVVTARRAHEVAAVAEEVRARGRRSVEVAADLRGDTPERLAAVAVEQLGRLDVWVNNAGGTDDPSVRPLAATSDEQLRDMLELNLVAVLACVRAAAAMSSGVPSRPSGTVAVSRGRSASVSCSASKNVSVGTMPGETALTRTPRGASSAARVAVRLRTAAFDAP